MYAKTLVPGEPPVPTLTATTSEMDTLLPQLLGFGWAAYGDKFPGNPVGQLRITAEQRLQLDVAGEVILEDANPAAPDGWWDAVDRGGGRCLVNVVRTGDVDLTDPGAGARMRGLLDQAGAGAWALIPITHT